MDITRNQWFMFGIIFLALGIQLRLVDSYELNEAASRAVTKQAVEQQPEIQKRASLFVTQVSEQVGVKPRRVIRPPEWIGWLLSSIGVVLIMHSLAMKRSE